jgi:hypothetical protein
MARRASYSREGLLAEMRDLLFTASGLAIDNEPEMF